MFMLRNVGKILFGSGSQESILELPQGQLYLVRPLSPKGYSELIFKDAAIRIRKTAQDFQYQLVVQRAYEEGEEELLQEEQGDDDAALDALADERDEKTFLLDEALHFRLERRDGGVSSTGVLAWRDLSGDTGDVYEFVCDDAAVTARQVDQFFDVARQCQYERKYRKPHTTASADDLEQFTFADEHPIPPASPLHSPTLTRSIESSDSMFGSAPSAKNTANMGAKRDATPAGTPTKAPAQAPVAVMEQKKVATPKAAKTPDATETYAIEAAQLYFFDFKAGSFQEHDDSVLATVTEVGKWKYWLNVQGKDGVNRLGINIVADINPVFNFEFLSFIFNQFTDDGDAYSWLLRFKDQPTMERFQEALLRCLWEQLNETKWEKVKEMEQQYVMDAFADMKMDDAEEDAIREEEEEEEESEQSEDEGARSEHYDSDESEDDTPEQEKDRNVNSQLAVGYAHDRSFVVRGSKIGVFKHTPSNKLEFATNISKVQTPNGKLFSPKKVMLHNEDRDMVLQHDTDPSRLYRMDLEYGKVVDEWDLGHMPVKTFAPKEKHAQMTGEQTFLGISHNALFRVDPRLSGQKLVDSDLKQYASKNDFSALATTDKGYVAVASNKGDIRLFNKLGINAKTHIPALGEPIIGMDVSADGRWILATCRTYLLLIDAQQSEDGANAGKLGFEKAFPKDAKPTPRRLAMTPEHVAQVMHETRKGVAFTPAKFNTGIGTEETSIITATGPYIVEWNLKKVLRGGKDPYRIKRYTEDIKADDFKFGTDKNVIVALPNEVNMVGNQSLKRPTRESIQGNFQRLSAARKSSGRVGTRESGRYKLGKDDVVDEY